VRRVLERDGAQQREGGRVEEKQAVRLQPAHGEELVVGADGEARRVGVRRRGVGAARLVRVQYVVSAEAAVGCRREEPPCTVRVGECEHATLMLLVLLEERGRRDVEDAHRAVVEAARDGVLCRVVGDGAAAALLHLELHQLLLHAVKLPHAHRAVARGRGELAVVRVGGEAVDDVGVRAEQCHVLLRRHVEHADGARSSADEQLETIRRGVGLARKSVVSGESVRGRAPGDDGPLVQG
jgi:hypothetical protein